MVFVLFRNVESYLLLIFSRKTTGYIDVESKCTAAVEVVAGV